MTDCPKCEYHKTRAARWRAEAYKQGGHDVIELPWVGLTDDEVTEILEMGLGVRHSIETALEVSNQKQARAAQATARIAITHLQAVLNTSRTHADQQAADTAARDWLISIGSEPT